MVALDLHEAGVARDLLDQPQRRKGVVGMYHHHSSAARVGAGLLLHRMWDAYTRCVPLIRTKLRALVQLLQAFLRSQ
jgi:hypothetical protein